LLDSLLQEPPNSNVHVKLEVGIVKLGSNQASDSGATPASLGLTKTFLHQ